MTKNSVIENIFYYLFCGFTGGVIALIIWLFLKLMNLGISLIWQTIPDQINLPFYTVTLCTIGGLILGIYQKLSKAVPDELNVVMAKVKREKYYPYNKTLLLCISALLPLLFGGSIGPEAGLTGVIVGLCYWAGNNMKLTKTRIPDVLDLGITATLGTVFFAPLFGLVAPNEEKLFSGNSNINGRKQKTVSNIIAVLCAIGVFFALNTLFGGGLGLPRIGNYSITNTERIWGIPIILLGVIFGVLFICFEKLSHVIFDKIKGKFGMIVSTTLGGLILGIIGTYLPLTMFSGEESITELHSDYISYAPWILILTGVLKLFLTNICIKSGWVGGHFFPVIFSGVSIGYGIAMLTGLDIPFCCAVITGAILGCTMKKPLAVCLLLMLCFDPRIIPWILISAFIGSIIPIGKKKKGVE